MEVEELEGGILVRPVSTLDDLLERWGPLGPPVTGAEIARTLRPERHARRAAPTWEAADGRGGLAVTLDVLGLG